MSLYVIADLHLSFSPGVDKPMDVFGPRWFNYEQRLESAWLERVGPEDTVVIPGDISWALKLDDAKADLDWVAALPGKKILLKGNHDLWWNGITKMNRMYDNMYFLQNTCARAEGVFICGSRGWITPDNADYTEDDEKIYRRELLRLESSLKDAVQIWEREHQTEDQGGPAPSAGSRPPIIGFLHYPPVADASRFSAIQQMFEDYGVKDVYYGHVHGEDGFRTAIKGEHHGINYHLISLDYLNCIPLKIR